VLQVKTVPGAIDNMLKMFEWLGITFDEGNYWRSYGSFYNDVQDLTWVGLMVLTIK